MDFSMRGVHAIKTQYEGIKESATIWTIDDHSQVSSLFNKKISGFVGGSNE